jgi:glycosyltransferase Alg8
MLGLLVYGALLLLVSLLLPAVLWDTRSPFFLLALGTVALFRYAWGATHILRAIIYRKLVFPSMRRQADAMGVEGLPSKIYLLMTSFRIDTETTRLVYAAAIREAAACGGVVKIVASVVEMADQRLIKHLFAELNPPDSVTLTFVRIPGTGKRDALAQGLRSISNDRPPLDSVICVVDGDTILTPGVITKCVPFFKMRPNMDALTTDEVCEVHGAAIFRDWYNLRFAQRQILMSSIGLSRRVLTLTGRLSIFRGRVATSPEFIKRLEDDSIDHWRLGRFRFLTGDDKSTWYYILKSGKEMLYIPDVSVTTIESPPDPSFVLSAGMLMQRWFGNMLRTNGRALQLGPRRMGLFVWWAILDQRISMWTTLIGPVGTLLAAVLASPSALLVYVYWVCLTRFVQTLAFLTARQEVRWNYPFLLFFNQIFGSVIKVYIFFRLDKQKWTRQKTVAVRQAGSINTVLTGLSSSAMHAVALMTFVVILGAFSGLLGWGSQTTALLLAGW